MTLTVLESVPDLNNTSSGSLTVSMSWIYTQGQSQIQNVPINLYDSGGNIIQTILVSPPEVFTFSGLASGEYSIGPATSITYDFNGAVISLNDCSVSIQAVVEVALEGEEPVFGCTDPNSCAYYDPKATQDDGSCLYTDCAGICGGTAVLDNCGDCVVPVGGICEEGYPLTGECVTVPCEQDCAGVWGGLAMLDKCDECKEPLDPTFNEGCEDCSGIANGTKFIDACGDCNEPDGDLWNTGCAACLDPCALNYDPDGVLGCEECCIKFDFKADCTCDTATTVPSITGYLFMPEGGEITTYTSEDVESTSTDVIGTITIGSGEEFVFNSVATTIAPDVTELIASELPYTGNGINSNGNYYRYGSAVMGTAGSNLVDGIYTYTLYSVTITLEGVELLTKKRISICKIVLCNIEQCLQKHMKNIMLSNKCCDCDALKETYMKAFSIYRALKIAETCVTKGHIEKSIKRLEELCSIMDNKICNNC
jgi:hypothetical protein